MYNRVYLSHIIKARLLYLILYNTSEVTIVNVTPKLATTELNDYDRKILNKYTGFYINLLESNAANTERNDNNRQGSEH